MKKFSNFIEEAKQFSKASFNARRLGLVGDEHGGWYGQKTGEFVAKTDNFTKDGLKFFNQNQIVGKKDPPQKRLAKPLVPQSYREKPNTPTRTEEYEKILREKYISKEIFLEGDWVKSITNEMVGKIIRRGTNYLICVTEDNKMFKPWIKDVTEWTDVSGVPANQREVGTDEYREYTMKMTGSKKIDNFNIVKFINKYKAKKKASN